jgi:hypothetical protein
MKYRIVERVKEYKSFTNVQYVVQCEEWDYINTGGGIAFKKSFPFIYLKEGNKIWVDTRKFSTFHEAKVWLDAFYEAVESYYNPGVDTIVYE